MALVVRCIGKNIERVEPEKVEESPVVHFTPEQVRSFRSVFRLLNDKDLDILYLIFVSRKKQKDVQDILKRSQPSLCYDIKRIRRRLQLIWYLHSVFDVLISFLRNRAEDFSPEERDILTLMYFTTSFTATARVLDTSQVRVRYAFNKCLRRMQEMELWDVYEIFVIVQSNLNLIRRVYRSGPTKVKRS